MSNVSKTTNLTVKVALFAAISVILMYVDFPVLPAFPWLKIDLSDLPALIGAFAFGPVIGIIIELLKNILIMLVKGTQTAGVGELANFIIGAAYVGCAGIIYKRNKTRMTALIAMIVSILFMSVIGVLANYFILIPLYMKGMPKADLIKYVLYGVIPFNLIKGALVSAITLLIYKRVSVIIRAEGFKSGNKGDNKKIA